MKKLFFLLITILVSSAESLLAQSPLYYDVLELSKYVDRGAKIKGVVIKEEDRVYEILGKYIDNSNITKADIVSAYNTEPNGNDPNPFIELGSLKKSGGTDIVPVKGTLVSAIGGLNVTNFADGLAKFLVERMKQELTVAFFQKFQEELKKDELKTLFPFTLKVFNTIDKDIYMFDAYLNTIQQAFIKDLTNFYAGFKELQKLPKYKLFFEKNPEVYTILINSFYIIDQYSKGIHPGKVLENYDTTQIDFSNKTVEHNLRNSVQSAKIFSQSIKSKSSEKYWISADSVSMLWKDSVLRDIYFGLVYQKGGKVNFKMENKIILTFQDILRNVQKSEEAFVQYQNYVQIMASDAQEVDEYLSAAKNKLKSEIDYTDYYNFYNASLDLFQDGFEFLELPYVNLGNNKVLIKRQSDKWLYVARTSGELYVDTRSKNYSSAILNVVTILDSLFDKSLLNTLNTDLIRYKTSVSALRSAGDAKKLNYKVDNIIEKYKNADNYAGDIERSISIIDSVMLFSLTAQERDSLRKAIQTALQINLLTKNEKIMSVILKYGTFASAVAQAQNSDDVKNAIEAIALPVGSSSIKRNTTCNISLNAFIGFYGGREYMATRKENQWANSIGLTAPVGFAFSWGNHKWKGKPVWKNGNSRGGKSIGFFIPLIDIGTLASYRLGDDSSKVVSDIKLENIISPGFYLHWGLGKSPISIMAGAQLGPQLRNVTAKNITVEKNYYIRYGMAITVDLPLLNLYTKTAPIKWKKCNKKL